MSMQRRHFIALATSAMGVAAAPARAAAGPLPISALGVDAGQFGVRPGSADDQTRALQRAIDETARTGTPLALAPGIYRTGQLRLSSGTHLVGARGATRLLPTQGESLLSGTGAAVLFSTALAGRCRSDADWCSLKAARPSRSRTARSQAPDATGSSASPLQAR